MDGPRQGEPPRPRGGGCGVQGRVPRIARTAHRASLCEVHAGYSPNATAAACKEQHARAWDMLGRWAPAAAGAKKRLSL